MLMSGKKPPDYIVLETLSGSAVAVGVALVLSLLAMYLWPCSKALALKTAADERQRAKKKEARLCEI